MSALIVVQAAPTHDAILELRHKSGHSTNDIRPRKIIMRHPHTAAAIEADQID